MTTKIDIPLSNSVMIPTKVIIAYNNILNSELIKSKIITEENINNFQKTIESIRPNYNELLLHNFIKELSRSSDNFDNFLLENNCIELILWCDIEVIIKYFGLCDSSDEEYTSDEDEIEKPNIGINKESKESFTNITYYIMETTTIIKPVEDTTIKETNDLLSKYEEDFLKEDDVLWNRRNALRRDWNKN
jgi:hypothetical protein